MKVRRMKSHPDFQLEGRSKHFQSFWELELTPGEQTTQHQHYESEEIIYLLNGDGHVRIAEKERSVLPGEVVLVPPRTDHIIANRSDRPLRAITVESRFDLGLGPPLSSQNPEQDLRAEEQARRSAVSIDELMTRLPPQIDEAVAIQTIVDLFDIGGQLAEEIETLVGLHNSRGLKALAEIERKIMMAVVLITGRYAQGGSPRQSWRFG